MDQPSSTESNAITLRIRFKSASLDEFIGRYGADVSPGGIFIRTKQPVEVGTTLQFDFTLGDGAPLLSGIGTVAWVRESDPARANNVPGMGLRFDKLTPDSQHTHQMILVEKARQEGKASATPYPPTAFVAAPARVSPSPEATKPAEAAPKVEPGSANFATTRPAPAVVVKPAQPAAPAAPHAPEPAPSPMAALFQSLSVSTDSGEFSDGGKTEVSDKPLDYYLREAQAAEEGKRAETKTSEDAVPQSLLDDIATGASEAPITKSGPPPEGFEVSEPTAEMPGEKLAPALAAASQPEPSVRAPFDLNAGKSEGAAESAAPMEEVLQELSAGVPIEETVPERTEEVVTSGAPMPEPVAPQPLDLGTGLETSFDERPPGRGRVPSLKPKSSFKPVAIIAVVAAAAAFVAVYLVKTKPWQDQAQTVAPVTSAPPAAEIPAVPPPAAPAAAPVAAPAKPAAEEGKPVVAERVEKKAPELSGEKAGKKEVENAGEKTAAEKPAGEKVAAKEESPSGKSPAKSGAKAKGEEKSRTSSDEEPFRIVVRSAPISAEVLIDGEYFSRTPCERRILEPSKTFAVTIRKEGYETYERLVGPSDNWAKKGEERVLTVTASLKRAKQPTAAAAPTEAKPEKKAEPVPAKPEVVGASEAGKPVAKESAKPEPVAAKPEPAKAEPAKAEPAKPAATPAADKPAVKPAPTFDDHGKAKE